MNNKYAVGGGVSTSKKLLAALAVLAVAFVALAAIPAVAEGDNAGDSSFSIEQEKGIIAAGYVADKTTAKGMIGLLSGIVRTDVDDSTMFVIFKTDGTFDGYKLNVNGTESSGEVSWSGEGTRVIYFKVASGATASDSLNEAWDPEKEYVVSITLSNGTGETATTEKIGPVTIVGETVTLYQDAGSAVASELVETTSFIKADGTSDSMSSAVLVNGNVTLDLNDKTLKCNTVGNVSVFIVNANAKNSNCLTVKNGSLDLMGYTDGTKAVISVAENGKIELNDVGYTTSGAALFPMGNASEVKVIDSEISAPVYVLGTNNQYSREAKLAIEISGSTLTASSDSGDNTPFSVNVKNAEATIKKSVLNGDRQVLFVRCGVATLEDTTINFSGKYSGTINGGKGTWGSGNEAISAAVLVGNTNGSGDSPYAGTAKLVMNGGSINATTGNALVVMNKDANGKTSTDVSISTDIKCGDATVTVTGLKYASSADDDKKTPLIVKKGSVELSGTIDSISLAGDVTVSGNLVITGDVTFADGVTIAPTIKITIEEGAKLTVSGTVTGNIENKGTIISKPGADLSDAKIEGDGKTVEDDSDVKEAYLSGEVVGADFGKNQKVIVERDTVITSGTLSISGTLLVKEGVTLTITANADFIIKDNATADILGAIVIEEAEDEADAIRDGTMTIERGTVNIAGTADIRGLIDVRNKGTLNITSDVTASGKIDSTGKIVIADSATLTVTGASTVSLYEVSAGGNLVFDSDVVSGDNEVLLKDGATVVVDSIVLGNDRTLTIKDEGTFTYADDKKEGVPTAGSQNIVTLTAGATVPSSTVIPEGAKLGALFTGLAVTDSFEKTKDAGEDVKSYTGKSTMTVSGDLAVDGIYFPASVSEETEVDVTGTMAMDVASGSAKVVFGETTIGKGITTSASASGTCDVIGKIAVAGSFTNNGAMTVSGIINATDKDASFTNAGTLTVTGEGSVTVGSALDGTKNAAYYTTGTAATAIHWYVTVDSAIATVNAGTTKTIEVLGKQTVDTTATLPAGSSMKITGKLAIGDASTEEGSKVVLTIASGAVVNADSPVAETVDAEGNTVPGTLTVNGTLYAEKKTDIKSALRSVIASDVKSEETQDGKVVGKGWAKWTNIYTALEKAKATDIITLQRSITLRDVTVPADVTLDVNGNTLTVAQKKTLKVVGTLDLTKDGSNIVLIKPTLDESSRIIAAGGAIDNEGYITYAGEDIEDAPIYERDKAEGSTPAFVTLPGAYYTIGTTTYLTTYLNGIADANNADGQGLDAHAILFIGDDGKVELGDVAITGEADKPVAIFVLESDFIVGNVTLNDAFIIVSSSDENKISGNFTNANGSVTIVGGIDAAIIGSKDQEGTQALVVSGTIMDLGDNVATSVTIDGTVYLDFASFDVDKVVVKGDVFIDAILDLGTRSGPEANFKDCTVSGTITIGENSELIVAGSLDIDGSITVGKTANLSAGFVYDEDEHVWNAEYATVVNGSIDASAEGAKAEFAYLFIGVSSAIIGVDYSTINVGSASADASVIGDVDVDKYAVASPGATVPEAFKDATKYKSTEFSSDGAVYMAVYTKISNSISLDQFKTSKDEAVFEGWYYTGSDGTEQKVSSSSQIGRPAAVYAKFVTEIYKIQITADGGVSYITVDGKLMKNEGRVFTFEGLTAGTHRIEISPVSGYDVSKTALYNPDGTAVGSMDINLSGGVPETSAGAFQYALVEYQLIGSTVVVPDTPEPTPIIIKDDKDSSLTDTLLIVLVVLIVIMAILVALRMMRS